MKFNFRKIASALASTAMVGSTVALAAAASYPAPFVDNGAADVAVVYGNIADMSAVTDITTSLSVALNSQGGDTEATGVGSDSVLLSKTSDLFNLGDSMGDIYSTLDDGELSTLLADGVYKNDDNDDFDYVQTIDLNPSTLEWFIDNDFNNDEPAMGFQYANDEVILNYTLNFKPDAAEGGVAWADFVGTTIEMMGSEYYILDASNDSGGSLDLLNSANSVVLNEGETINVGGFSVSLSFIDNTNVKLVVDGETTPALQEDDTYALDSGDYIGIQEILSQDYEGGSKQVEFSIGTGKIELSHGDEVKLNGEDISDDTDYVIMANFTQAGTGNVSIDQFMLEWRADVDMYLGVGTDSTELTMPGFENVKIVLGDFNTASEEATTLKAGGDETLQLSTTITDGPITMDLFYLNSSANQIVGLGEDADNVLVTTNGTAQAINLDEDEDSYFAATWYSGDDHESYVFQLSNIDNDDDNTTTLKNLAGGADLSLAVGDTETIGEVDITLTAAYNENDGNGTAIITLGTDVYADRLVSADGLLMLLPVNGSHSWGDQFIHLEEVSTNWTMNFTEETDSGTIGSGIAFGSYMDLEEDEGVDVGRPSSTNSEDWRDETDDSDWDVSYLESSLSTKLRHDNPSGSDELGSLEITYFGEETSIDVFVSSGDLVSSDDESDTGALGSVDILDDELAASGLSGNNLIVVGGSCINSVAAGLLGVSEGTCADDWTAVTDAGVGQYVVQTFAQDNGKVATLVAGWEKEETVAAATFLTTQSVTTDAGMKYIDGAEVTTA